MVNKLGLASIVCANVPCTVQECCVECPTHCEVCSDANTCTTCAANYHVKAGGQCTSDCHDEDPGFFLGGDQICKACADDCLECDEKLVTINYGFQTVEACPGSAVKIVWEGYHNIQETTTSNCNSVTINDPVVGFFGSGYEKTFYNDEIAAQPGETRYFKCDSRCGASSARFEVTCPSEPTPSSVCTNCASGFHVKNDGSCEADIACSVPIAQDDTFCTSQTMADKSNLASIVCASVPCTVQECCAARQMCADNNAYSCAEGKALVPGARCAGELCAETEFTTGGCCGDRQTCSNATGFDCASGFEVNQTATCAGTQCVSGEFGDDSTTCCSQPASGASATCSTIASDGAFCKVSDLDCETYCAANCGPNGNVRIGVGGTISPGTPMGCYVNANQEAYWSTGAGEGPDYTPMMGVTNMMDTCCVEGGGPHARRLQAAPTRRLAWQYDGSLVYDPSKSAVACEDSAQCGEGDIATCCKAADTCSSVADGTLCSNAGKAYDATKADEYCSGTDGCGASDVNTCCMDATCSTIASDGAFCKVEIGGGGGGGLDCETYCGTNCVEPGSQSIHANSMVPNTPQGCFCLDNGNCFWSDGPADGIAPAESSWFLTLGSSKGDWKDTCCVEGGGPPAEPDCETYCAANCAPNGNVRIGVGGTISPGTPMGCYVNANQEAYWSTGAGEGPDYTPMMGVTNMMDTCCYEGGGPHARRLQAAPTRRLAWQYDGSLVYDPSKSAVACEDSAQCGEGDIATCCKAADTCSSVADGTLCSNAGKLYDATKADEYCSGTDGCGASDVNTCCKNKCGSLADDASAVCTDGFIYNPAASEQPCSDNVCDADDKDTCCKQVTCGDISDWAAFCSGVKFGLVPRQENANHPCSGGTCDDDSDSIVSVYAASQWDTDVAKCCGPKCEFTNYCPGGIDPAKKNNVCQGTSWYTCGGACDVTSWMCDGTLPWYNGEDHDTCCYSTPYCSTFLENNACGDGRTLGDGTALCANAQNGNCAAADEPACCVDKALCSSGFVDADCGDKIVGGGFCAGTACTDADKDTCCVDRAKCSTYLDSNACADDSREYDASNADTECADWQCTAADETTCCADKPNAKCSTYSELSDCDDDSRWYDTSKADTECASWRCRRAVDETTCCADKPSAKCSTVSDGSICSADRVYDTSKADTECASWQCTWDADETTCCTDIPDPVTCKIYYHGGCPASQTVDDTGTALCEDYPCGDGNSTDKDTCCKQRGECATFYQTFQCNEGRSKPQDTSILPNNGYECAGVVCDGDDEGVCCVDNAKCTDGYEWCNGPTTGKIIHPTARCSSLTCGESEFSTCCVDPKAKCSTYLDSNACADDSRRYDASNADTECTDWQCTAADETTCCVDVAQRCDESTRTCEDGFRLDATAYCAGAECLASEFGNETTTCCHDPPAQCSSVASDFCDSLFGTPTMTDDNCVGDPCDIAVDAETCCNPGVNCSAGFDMGGWTKSLSDYCPYEMRIFGSFDSGASRDNPETIYCARSGDLCAHNEANARRCCRASCADMNRDRYTGNGLTVPDNVCKGDYFYSSAANKFCAGGTCTAEADSDTCCTPKPTCKTWSDGTDGGVFSGSYNFQAKCNYYQNQVDSQIPSGHLINPDATFDPSLENNIDNALALCCGAGTKPKCSEQQKCDPFSETELSDVECADYICTEQECCVENAKCSSVENSTDFCGDNLTYFALHYDIHCRGLTCNNTRQYPPEQIGNGYYSFKSDVETCCVPFDTCGDRYTDAICQENDDRHPDVRFQDQPIQFFVNPNNTELKCTDPIHNKYEPEPGNVRLSCGTYGGRHIPDLTKCCARRDAVCQDYFDDAGCQDSYHQIKYHYQNFPLTERNIFANRENANKTCSDGVCNRNYENGTLAYDDANLCCSVTAHCSTVSDGSICTNATKYYANIRPGNNGDMCEGTTCTEELDKDTCCRPVETCGDIFDDEACQDRMHIHEDYKDGDVASQYGLNVSQSGSMCLNTARGNNWGVVGFNQNEDKYRCEIDWREDISQCCARVPATCQHAFDDENTCSDFYSRHDDWDAYTHGNSQEIFSYNEANANMTCSDGVCTPNDNDDTTLCCSIQCMDNCDVCTSLDACIECAPGFHLKDDDSCEADIQCSDFMEEQRDFCGETWTGKPDRASITCASVPCTLQECCAPLQKCAEPSVLTCGDGFQLKPLALCGDIECDTEDFTDGACCYEILSCSDPIAQDAAFCSSQTMADKADLASITCAGETCTVNECCDAKCSVQIAQDAAFCTSHDYHLDKADLASITCAGETCTVNECCDVRQQCMDDASGGTCTGTIAIDDYEYCAGVACDASDFGDATSACCNPRQRCTVPSSLTCDEGFRLDTHRLCADTECGAGDFGDGATTCCELDCPENCLACSDPDTCTACASGFRVKGDGSCYEILSCSDTIAQDAAFCTSQTKADKSGLAGITCAGETCTVNECCDVKCSIQIAQDAAFCTSQDYHVDKSDLASIVCANMTCTVQQCCDVRQQCVDDASGGTCTDGTMRDDDEYCAGAACAAGDFGDASSACCLVRQACTVPSLTCDAGFRVDDAAYCAGDECLAGEFGDGATTCCELDCPDDCLACSDSATCTTCASGFVVEGGGCANCPTNCLACSDSATCTTCDSGSHVNEDGSGYCEADIQCSDQIAEDAGHCTEQVHLDKSDLAGITCASVPCTVQECCDPRQACTDDTSGGACSDNTVVDVTGYCAGEACNADEFGDGTTTCCAPRQECGTSTRTCNAGFRVEDASQLCAGAACVAGEFGDDTLCCDPEPTCSGHIAQDATFCTRQTMVGKSGLASIVCAGETCTVQECCAPRQQCKDDASGGTCTGLTVRDDAAYCPGAACGAGDFGNETSVCCVLRQRCEESTRKCADGHRVDVSEVCAGAVCGAGEFGDAAWTCCEKDCPENCDYCHDHGPNTCNEYGCASGFHRKQDGSCEADIQCSDQIAQDAAHCTRQFHLDKSDLAGITCATVPCTVSECCHSREKCDFDAGLNNDLCNGNKVISNTAYCIGRICDDTDWEVDYRDGACCGLQQACAASTRKCNTGYKLINTQRCASTSCAAGDFGDAATPCCEIDCPDNCLACTRQVTTQTNMCNTCASGFHVKNDGSCEADIQCSDQIAQDAAHCTGQFHLDKSDLAGITCATVPCTVQECCVPRQACTDDTTGGACTGNDVISDTAYCADTSCVAGDFGDGACCGPQQECVASSSLTCNTGFRVVTAQLCANTQCKAGEFGDAATTCCDTEQTCSDPIAQDSTFCTSHDYHLDKAGLASITCAQVPCTVQECCDPRQQCMDDATNGTCTGTAVIDGYEYCAGVACGASDFGDATSACCSPRQKCKDSTSLSCDAGFRVDTHRLCAEIECLAGEFGDGATTCCELDCPDDCLACSDPDTCTACASGFHIKGDGSGNCEADIQCSDQIAEDQGHCTSQLHLDKADLAGITCATVPCTVQECCDPRQACTDWTLSTCTGNTVRDDAAYCAGTVCTASEFANATSACCVPRQQCGDDTSSGTCTDNTVRDDAPYCAGALCAAGDFGDATSACCVPRQQCGDDTSNGTCTGNTVNDDDKYCVGTVCAASDFADVTSACCVPKQQCSGWTLSTCTGTTVRDDDKYCVGTVCAASDFADATSACCDQRQQCGDDTSNGTCPDNTVHDDDKYCVGAACNADDFAGGTSACCAYRQACSDSTMACDGGIVPNRLGLCADTECVASEFGDAATTCCTVKNACSAVDTCSICGLNCDFGFELDQTAICAGEQCDATNFGDATTTCCKPKAASR